MRREQRPTKKDFECIIRIFEVDGTDGETYIEYKWKKASSSAIITMKEANKYDFEQQINEYLKDKEITKINKITSVDREKLRDMPKYYCTIGFCYKKFNSSDGRDKHELYSHIKK